MRLKLMWILLVVLLPQICVAQANTCDRAAQRAAQKTGVPLDVLLALTRTETGRRQDGKLQPWPWTVNMEGAGHWFANEDSARAYVFKHFKSGARSFDVGCFQINYKWHGNAFRSIEAMFDPEENALYAANFLKSLKKPNHTWEEAAGAYHSNTPSYAQKYKRRFTAIRTALSSTPLPKPGVARANGFPLLQLGNSGGGLGSLVGPQTTGAKPFIAIGGQG
ncbi:transglycosylase SLT domain-containing protein [Thalassobius sp. S69A]|uniref:transglycosylase SLT domain-containing protein n=1 Tax=unclassified Thalassovita TaxID=2619711 RepID=UPI000C0F0F4F|nr:tail length tape measure protein [Paracoccaceae bacterium]MBT26132.1 tail length tape measure protein [Paracoccaceae bacterium]